MDSPGNGMDRWTRRQGGRSGELMEPAPPPGNGTHLSPVKPIGSADHLLQLSARADSAYSSFSGGSNAPECPTPSCYGESCCLPPEQGPYMDSDYVRGIYHLSAANPDLRCQHPHKAPDLSIHSHPPSISLAGGSTPARGTSNQGALGVPPPSPPSRLDSYQVTKHLEKSRGRRSSGSHRECGGQPAACVQDAQPGGREVPRSPGRGAEQDAMAAKAQALQSEHPSVHATGEELVAKTQGLRMEENGEWSLCQHPGKRSNPHISSRPSSFIFQEYLRADSVANVPRILSVCSSVQAHRTPEEMNALKPYRPVHASLSSVNDPPGDKPCPCAVPKPTLGAAEPCQPTGSSCCAQCPRRAGSHADLDQDVFEDAGDLKCLQNGPLAQNASRMLKTCTGGNQCYEPWGGTGGDGREVLWSQQGRLQRASLPSGCDAVQVESPRCEELDQGRGQCCGNAGQVSLTRPKEDCTPQLLREAKVENQADGSKTHPSMHLEPEESPGPYQKHQPEVHKQLFRQLQEDLAGEQMHLEPEEPPGPYKKYQPELQEQLFRQLQEDLAGEQMHLEPEEPPGPYQKHQPEVHKQLFRQLQEDLAGEQMHLEPEEPPGPYQKHQPEVHKQLFRQLQEDLAGEQMHLEPEEPPGPYKKYQPELQEQLFRQLQEDLAGEQISRQTTPMLYYLSGGKATNVLHHKKLAQCQEDLRSSPKESPAGSSSASAWCLEVQRERDELQRSSHQPQCSAAELLETEDLVLGSPASSTEESFKNDYREKLKVAQKKVLRETSFKRKDLQMSLPVRLRQKPSKRPSIEHLRSFSLSSASEDAKAAPCSPPHLESLESFSRDEDIRRPQTRIGGRKRVTKEQKKLCYSEPEKLDQLADQDLPWGQVRDEMAEQDMVAARRGTLENRGRALSSSGVSRMELKQIQHTALIEYMERKINQRPGSARPLPVHKPQPLQKRLPHPKWPPPKAPHPNESRKVQTNEASCQVFSTEASPDVFPSLPLVAPLNVASGCDPSAAAGAATSGHEPAPSQAGGSCTSRCSSAERLLQAGGPVAGRAPERSKSTPPSVQDTSGPAAPSGCCESCHGAPSFHDPERGGWENHGSKGSDTTGLGCCHHLTPQTSIPAPRSGSKDDAEAEEEGRKKSLPGNVSSKSPEQQPAAPQEQASYCHTALAHQGDKATDKGWVAKEASTQSSQEGLHPEREPHLPKGRLQSPEEQRYEELAMEIIAKDSSLGDVLMPHPVSSTALHLMEGLFPVSISLLGRARRHQQEPDRKGHGDSTEECSEAEGNTKQRSQESTPKGSQGLTGRRGSTNDLDDITSKKRELISCLQSKLQRLWEERELVLADAQQCSKQGEELEALVRELCKPNEFERYMMFIGDLEKVVSLLLCLSTRLARVQNAISRVDGSTDAEEKQSLSERHKLLSRQREDAKDLKENLDRRERVVAGILAKYLTDQQLQDYRCFVQVKTSLLIEQKDLEEQIKFFEEQLEHLEQSIPL
ncbi:protein Shroom1 [Pogoniulus pusillus]|uniref:protein Shroom1 n=1 Tax=Pogoniulus pusillus TaxID=488313 RepID=UPI0030B992C4